LGTDHSRASRLNINMQWVAFIGTAIAAVGLAELTARVHPEFFYPYFGAIPPGLAIAVAAILSAFALWGLDQFGYRPHSILQFHLKPVLLALGLTVPFVSFAILLDITMRFGADINVALPWAAGFYLSIAFFVETAIHAVPFAAVYLLLDKLFGYRRMAAAFAIVLPSFIEPMLQIYYASEGGTVSALALMVGVHVFAINVTQLLLFWRLGFWPILTFRLTYYALWHIAWGEVRLAVLF